MAYYSRSDWAARSPKSRSVVAARDRKEFVVHYAEEQEAGPAATVADCGHMVRGIQNFHMDSRGWSDIAYNFLVCVHGDIFEGRGWDVIGAHSPNHNLIGIGVCFIGNDDPGTQDASPATLAAIKWLAVEADRRSGRALVRQGHKDTQRPGYTSCPGVDLETWVQAGMPLTEVSQPVPAAPATPAPVPNSNPAPATEPDWTGAMLMNLPTLKTGAKGEYVKRVQGLLISHGEAIKVDGDFGPATDAAVKRFQHNIGLVSDGVIGQKSWRALIGG